MLSSQFNLCTYNARVGAFSLFWFLLNIRIEHLDLDSAAFITRMLGLLLLRGSSMLNATHSSRLALFEKVQSGAAMFPCMCAPDLLASQIAALQKTSVLFILSINDKESSCGNKLEALDKVRELVMTSYQTRTKKLNVEHSSECFLMKANWSETK